MGLSNVVELSTLSICPDTGDEFASLLSNSTRPVPTGGVEGCHTPKHNFYRHRTNSGISVGK